MIKGVFYAIGACALWGLVFAIPGLLKDNTPFEIAFGRCTVFGLFSIGMLLLKRKAILQFLTFSVARQALQLSFIVNILHYIALASGLQYGNETLTTVILGANPIAIACYSNFLNREIGFRYLVIPCFLTAVGLLVLHYPILST